jgi:hypothetical protein
MHALWAEPHVTFKGKWHTIEDAGINPRQARSTCSAAAHLDRAGRPRARRGRIEVWVSMGSERKRIGRGGRFWKKPAVARDPDDELQPPHPRPHGRPPGAAATAAVADLL